MIKNGKVSHGHLGEKNDLIKGLKAKLMVALTFSKQHSMLENNGAVFNRLYTWKKHLGVLGNSC